MKINLRVEIKRVSDGVIASSVWPDWEWSEEAGAFWWEEGNAACDCNRRSFFNEAQGINEDENDESWCGNGGYLVRLTNNDTGEELYEDFSDEVTP